MVRAGPPIRVAVVGGGLGGTVLTHALMECENIDVNVYEANATFKERGASVGLAENAQRALALMGLGHVLEKAGAVNVNGARCIMGEGPDRGKKVLDFEGKLATVHRAPLLRELMSAIPAERMHVNKRLVSINDKDVKFEDGTTVQADVIIGADGIHSSVRRFILGEGNPAINPVHAGLWDARCVVPFDTALAKLGPEMITLDNPRQTIYSGNGVVFFYDTIDDGKSICVVAAGSCPDEWDKTQWKQAISKEWLNNQTKNWESFSREMINMLCGTDSETPAFIEWESGETPTLFRDNICMMGDAAHATTPWQGAGLGQAIEDALILKTALAQCNSVDDISAAFKAYDELMRPRGQRVINSSRKMGHLVLGVHGLDAKVMGATMKPMWDFIHQWDTEAAVRDVAEAVRHNVSSKS